MRERASRASRRDRKGQDGFETFDDASIVKASLRTASRPLIANPYATNTKLLINTIARGKQRREKRTELRIRHQGRSSLECAFWSRRARGDVDGGKFFELPLRPLPVYYALPTRREAQDISFLLSRCNWIAKRMTKRH